MFYGGKNEGLMEKKKCGIKGWERIENKQIKKAEVFILFTEIVIDKCTLIKTFVAQQSII